MPRVDFSSDAHFFTKIRFNAPERGSTTRVASALRCAAGAAPDSSLPRRAQRNASHRIAPNETGTAHTWKTQTKADAQA
ncbi:hypothetical protein [Burkholderia sp. 567]|uniref:hypothetical protein n=1 Tax=Burkholderia sp. 567 TaxID=3156413 RepID=UPI00339B7EB1